MKVYLALASLLAALLIPVAAGQAAADPLVSGEFTVPGGIGTNAQITAGPDGNMWVPVEAGNDVARIAADGTVTEFAAATITNAVGMVAGPDGNIWVTQPGGVASFAPGSPTVALAYAIPEITDARAITVGSDGNLWTASADKVIRIPPANPAGYTAFAATGVLGARWIASASDGTLWVADFGGQQMVNITTAGAGTGYPTPGGPQGVAAGEAGAIGYSNPTAVPQNVGRLSPGGTPATVVVPGADPFGVAFGADKAYWFALFAGNALGRLAPDGSLTTLGGFSANAGPRQLAVGPADTLWVVLDTAEKVARVTGVSAPPPPPPPPPPAPPAPTPEPPAPAPAPGTGIGNPAPASVVAVRRDSRIRLTVSTQCRDQFRFRLQKLKVRQGVPTWRNVGKWHKTKGVAHRRVLNKGKGTYRAVVAAACGYDPTTTTGVTLRR